MTTAEFNQLEAAADKLYTEAEAAYKLWQEKNEAWLDKYGAWCRERAKRDIQEQVLEEKAQ